MAYTLGETVRFSSKVTSPVAFTDTKTIEGIRAWARNEKTGEYVRVYEYATEQYVDGEAQAESKGNPATIEAARRIAKQAYKYVNR